MVDLSLEAYLLVDRHSGNGPLPVTIRLHCVHLMWRKVHSALHLAKPISHIYREHVSKGLMSNPRHVSLRRSRSSVSRSVVAFLRARTKSGSSFGSPSPMIVKNGARCSGCKRRCLGGDSQLAIGASAREVGAHGR